MFFFLKQIKERFQKLHKAKLDERIFTFSIFLIISAFFWFLNALNRQYTTTINYPVKFINFPADKSLISKLPSHFELKIESQGFTLVKHKISAAISPVFIDLTLYRLKHAKNQNPLRFYIVAEKALDNIANQIGTDLKLLAIQPDTVFFEFSDIVTRKVKVYPDISYELEKQCIIKGKLTCIPDCVMVKGPDKIVDTLKFVKTKPQKFLNVDQTIIKQIGFTNYDNLEFIDKLVIITIPVDQFTEAKTLVTIHTRNLPDSISIKTFPSQVTVLYLIGLSDYKKIMPELFNLEVDYNVIKAYRPDFLKVELVSCPDFVRMKNYYPKTVEYTIERR